jgi:hypothetical protein
MNKLLVVLVAVAPYLAGCAAVFGPNPQTAWTTTDGPGDTTATADTSGDDATPVILDVGYYGPDPFGHREHPAAQPVAQRKPDAPKAPQHPAAPPPPHAGTHAH